MASTAPKPSKAGFANVLKSFHQWWKRDAAGTVDQAEVIAKRREEAELSARYLLMITMAAGIAILGLLLSSPAVVIGAMLLSPLMGPIMGLGFAIATGDFNWMRESARTLAVGTAFSILFCALVVLFSPLQTVTAEIAARTRPNLFDLLVAVFSAIAGAYAMIRGREGTIVGVAIATALMPPLAVVGFGLATWNGTVFWGALLLFFTNLMAIALTAAAMARLYGFRTSFSEKQTWVQTALIVTAFVALAIPLSISLRTIAWEARAQRDINSVVMDGFDNRARLSQIETDLRTDPIQVAATVLTPELQPDAEAVARRALRRALDMDVDVTITQYRVGTARQAAEQAQLTATIAREKADLEKSEDLAARLALVAGVPVDDVTVDRERLRATVRAAPLDGASLGAYAELERRISSAEPDWDIRLTPPARPLPEIPFTNEGEMTEGGKAAIELIAWAHERIPAAIVLNGHVQNSEKVQAALSEQGINARVGRWERGTSVSPTWAAPEE